MRAAQARATLARRGTAARAFAAIPGPSPCDRYRFAPRCAAGEACERFAMFVALESERRWKLAPVRCSWLGRLPRTFEWLDPAMLLLWALMAALWAAYGLAAVMLARHHDLLSWLQLWPSLVAVSNYTARIITSPEIAKWQTTFGPMGCMRSPRWHH